MAGRLKASRKGIWDPITNARRLKLNSAAGIADLSTAGFRQRNKALALTKSRMVQTLDAGTMAG